MIATYKRIIKRHSFLSDTGNDSQQPLLQALYQTDHVLIPSLPLPNLKDLFDEVLYVLAHFSLAVPLVRSDLVLIRFESEFLLP